MTNVNNDKATAKNILKGNERVKLLNIVSEKPD